MQLRFTREDLIIGILKYLWIIILMPKMVQFFVYAAVVILLLSKRNICLNKPAQMFLCGAAVQILAIIRQCILYDPSLSRIAASINTTAIWIIGAIVYSVYSESVFSEQTMRKIYRYTVINISILFCLWLFSLVAKADSFTLLGYTWQLRRMDYLSSGITKRFSALTETVLGPSHLLGFSLPLLMMNSELMQPEWNKGSIRMVILAVCAYIAVYATHSRMGALCCAGMLAVFFMWLLYVKTSRRAFRRIVGLSVVLLVVAAIMNRDILTAKFISLFHARAGSNNARFTIYRLSIQAAMESPLIGCGIKNMINMGDGYSFPYGSHSTYIGLFYKTGVLGVLFYMLGFAGLFHEIWKKLANLKNRSCIILIYVCYFVFLLFADLDASNWVLVSAFAVWGILSNQSIIENFRKEAVNE